MVWISIYLLSMWDLRFLQLKKAYTLLLYTLFELDSILWIEANRFTFLCNTGGTQLYLTCICVDIKRLLEIWICRIGLLELS